MSLTGRTSDTDGVESVDIRSALRMGALRSGEDGRFPIV